MNIVSKFKQKSTIGAKAHDHTMGLGSHIKFNHVRGEGVGTKRAPGPILMGPKLLKGRSEEECLIGRTKYSSNMHSVSTKDLLQRVLVAGRSPQARKREKSVGCRGGDYSCHIKCMTATFLATLMWRGLANSVTLATTTHRKMGEMSDGMGTQVKIQMINKCKVLMTSRGLYKRKESP